MKRYINFQKEYVGKILLTFNISIILIIFSFLNLHANSMFHQNISIQQHTVSGIVTDESGEPLPGVTVMVKGTNIGGVSNADGEYSLTKIPDDAVLQFSFVGMRTLEVVVGDQTSINVTMEEDKIGIEEVVAVGYGTQRKINLTGAVSQIGSEDIQNRPAPNLTRMIQGTLPNLNIKMIDGSPTRSADFNIRGMTSIGAGGNALVLIDGVEGDPNLINPKDVESISILKDASSAAIYGSRAAFGVVLITTKSAKDGKSTLNIDVSQSLNQRIFKPNLITDGYEWAQNFDEAFLGWFDYKTRAISVNNFFPFSGEYLNELKNHSENPDLPDVVYNNELDRYEYYGSTDWDNLLHKNSIPATEVSISTSGGTEKANFYLSGLYYYQDGIFNYSSDKFNKYNLRGKGEIELTNWLSFQNNFDLSNYEYEYPLLANGDINIWRYLDVVGFPIAVMNNPDGTYTRAAAYTGAPFFDGSSRSRQSNFLIRNTSGLKATFFDDLLLLNADFSFYQNLDKDKRVNNYIGFSEKPGSSSRFGTSLLRQYNNEKSFWSSNITAELNETFGDSHNVKLLIGYNIEKTSIERLNTRRDGLLVPSKPDYNLLDGQNYSITGGGNEWAFMGIFYRANYNFKNKYLLELNGRYDGSSKFPQDQRFGFFPSASAGWNISEEIFMENTRSWLNNLKIRASYGSLGNGNVAPYRYLELMSVGKTGVILEDIQKAYTNLPGVIPDGLTWEKATTLNLGLDAILFNNRFGLTFELYDRKTTDMFTYGQPLPNVFGATVPFGNYADLSTKGWELTLSWKDQGTLAGKPFNYNISGSAWDSKSLITRFNNPTKTLASTYYEGHQIGDIWGYETLGLFTSEEEIENHANQDYLRNSNNNQWLPGDLKFADLNNDGFINPGDNTVDNP
ncbi:MAG: SusC/RagA family TonB-linked outer membrane protein, partial [Bacteroidales bacterium]